MAQLRTPLAIREETRRTQLSRRLRRTPGDGVAALSLEPGEQARDVGRVVLQVGVERDDDLAARGAKAGGEGGRLAGVPACAEDPQGRIHGRETRELCERSRRSSRRRRRVSS